jgi:hypothetical protein
MVTKSDLREAYQAIVFGVREYAVDNTCIHCGNQGVHKDDCIVPKAVSYLSIDKKERMKRLVDVIKSDLNINVTTNPGGHITDCDML